MGMPATHMRHHVHVPWTTIIVVIVAVAIAAAILYAVNREPVTTTETPAVSTVVPITDAAAMPRPENRVFFNDINWWVNVYKPSMRPATAMADYGAMHFPVGTEGGRFLNSVSQTSRDPTNPYWRIEFPNAP